MISKIKKPISILLVFMMIVSLFAIVPITASAEVGDFVPESEYLTFTAEEAGSSVTLKVNSGSNLQYDLNGTGLTAYTPGTTITLASAGDYVRFRGKDTRFNASNHVSITGKVACSGNVMSLMLDDNGKSQGLSNNCFDSMFDGCTGLTSAPELPETDLKDGCYGYMFYGCTNLTTAPELPATALADRCYRAMFNGCERLTTAPELPATTLAIQCYINMFSGCTSLTTAPELPATSLAPYCYGAMFAGCTSLTTAPELPATTLATGCYSRMFYRCSSIKLSETQTDEYSIPYSVPSGGGGTTASSALDNMFAGTGGTFTSGTPEINKPYYRPAKKYTVTWKNEDGTTIDTTSVYEGTTPTYDGADPEKAEDEKYTYTFAGWSPEITAVTGDATYTAQYMATFKGITSDELYEGRVINAGTPIKFLMMSTNQIYQGIELEVYLDDVQVKSLKVNPGSSTEPDRYYTPTKKCIVDSYTVLRGQTAIHTLYLKSLNTVTWKNGDDVLETDNDVAFGTTPTYDGAEPTKAEDETNTYTFAGWSPAIAPVTEDVTYTAQFDATPKTPAATASYVKVTTAPDDWSGDYLIVYEDEDEGTAFNGSADGLNSSGNYIYVTISGGEIESNAETDAAKVTIAQIDGGYSIKTATGAYIGGVSGSNAMASSDDAIVNTISLEDDSAKIVSNNSTLRFNSTWSGFRYYRTVSQKPVQLYKLTGGSAPATYTVTWKNGDTVLETDTDVAEGATPSYDGETPYKADGANCIYTFSGWTPEVSAVTGDATYTATFTESEKPETIKDCNNKYDDFRLYSNVPIVSFSNVNDLLTGAIIPITYGDGNTMIPIQDAKGYSYKFYDQTGTELTTEITSSSSAPGSNYEFSDDVTVYTNVINFTRPAGCTAIYIVATVPEPTPVEIFTQHSITLGGDIGVNFYLDSAVLDTYTGTKTVKFTCDGEETTVDVPATPTADGYKVTRNVVAAQMAHTITATLYVDGELVDTDDYSVKEYAETVYANPEAYDDKGKPDELKALVKALLNYGAMAQTVFDSALTEKPALANATVGDNGYEGVTADQIEGAINDEASDLNAIAEQLGAKYYTNSLIYLSKNTLRIYFTPTSYPGEIPNAGAYDGNLSGYYYYVDHANIPAAELDNQQTFTVGGTTFTFSALDYAYAVVESDNMTETQKNLAKALYLYNQKANAYFDAAPAPAENEVISSGLINDFSTLNVGDYIAKGVEFAADIEYKVVLTGGTYGTESRDGIVVRNGDYNFNAEEYGMGTYSAHVPQPNVFIEDYNENEKFYPAVDGVEGNAFVVVAKDDTQKIITIAGANVTQN